MIEEQVLETQRRSIDITEMRKKEKDNPEITQKQQELDALVKKFELDKQFMLSQMKLLQEQIVNLNKKELKQQQEREQAM